VGAFKEKGEPVNPSNQQKGPEVCYHFQPENLLTKAAIE
jgi:hypothetical protein